MEDAMAEQDAKPSGPDLSQGVSFTDLADGGTLLGHVGDEQVLLARTGAELFAVGASCSHYHGPLAEGLLVGDTVRCPWHHACFSLRTGEAERAPAFDPVPCWRVERRDGRLFVRDKLAPPARRSAAAKPAADTVPERIVIVGGGAAGLAPAERPPRGHRAGGVDPAAARWVLRGERDRPAPQRDGDRDRPCGAARRARGRGRGTP